MARKLTVVIAGEDKTKGAFGSAERGAGKFGKAMGKVALASGAAIAAMGVVGGKALFDLGSSFNDADNTIRIGTGATGEALEGLEGSFRTVFGSVPTNMGDASAAIADLNTRLGLTGEPLETLAVQFINLSRITGTDVATNIDNMTRTFGDWGVATDDQAEAMDKMYRASQASGIGIEELSKNLVTFGAPLRNIGFDLDQSTAMLAVFNKTGVNTEAVVAGMKIGVGNLAKAGEDVPETFKRIVDEITNLGPGTEATRLAIELFGTRAGPDLADAIAGGKFELDDMLASIQNGTDTINGAAADTEGFGEKWNVIKNRIFVGLEPLATRIFDGMGQLMDKLGPKIDSLIAAFEEGGLSGAFALIAKQVEEVWPAVKIKLAELGASLVAWLGEQVPIFAAKLVEWYKAYIEWIVPLIPVMLEKFQEVLKAIVTWLVDEGLEMIVLKLTEWALAFVEWVLPIIVPMTLELMKLQGEMMLFMAESLLKLTVKLLEWAGEFALWVGKATLKMLAELPGLLLSLVKWAATDGITALYGIGIRLADSARNGLKTLWAKAVSLIASLPGKIGAAVTAAASAVYNKGKQLGQKFADGAKAAVAGLAGSLLSAIPGAGAIGSAAGKIRGLFHTGGTYRAPTPGGQGLALLRDGERVTTPGRSTGGAGGAQQIIVQLDSRVLVDALVRYDREMGTSIVTAA